MTTPAPTYTEAEAARMTTEDTARTAFRSAVLANPMVSAYLDLARARRARLDAARVQEATTGGRVPGIGQPRSLEEEVSVILRAELG